MARRPILWLAAVLTVSLWGSSFVLTKVALGWLGPTGLAFVRWGVGAVVLLAWVAARGRWRSARQLLARDGLRVTWIALVGITLFYIAENVALRYTTATNAGVLINLTSVFMVFMGALWLGERLKAIEWLALAMAFIGAALVSQGAGHLSLSADGLRGDLLIVLASVFAAAYSVGSKRLVAVYPADVATAMVAAVGAILLLPPALIEGMSLRLPPVAWITVAALGVGASALANLWWLYILQRTTASRASMILFLIPVIATALAVVALGEPLTPIIIAGAVLVLTGVALTQQDGVRRTPPPEAGETKP